MESEDLDANARNKFFVMFLGHDVSPQLIKVPRATESDMLCSFDGITLVF